MLDNFLNDLFFLFFLVVSSEFGNERVVSVLDHVFCASVVENRNQLRPFLSKFDHKIEDNKIFLRSPVSMLLVLIQMIQPSLSAVLSTLESFKVGGKEDISGHFIPLAFFTGFNSLS
jgi:hypothetical protein